MTRQRVLQVGDDHTALERETRGAGGEVGEPVREAAANDGGRYGWTLQVDDQPVRILMPGVGMARLRDLTTEAPADGECAEPAHRTNLKTMGLRWVIPTRLRPAAG
ncbi:hypothetical protein ACIA5C_48270 [Actinoplanes sp. NPDC051343]|uniref:hypothetical protein n=1 Tax=Actinoplanes sp. NPDC051343 TaxID=3363906 RepID=UPI0037ADF288